MRLETFLSNVGRALLEIIAETSALNISGHYFSFEWMDSVEVSSFKSSVSYNSPNSAYTEACIKMPNSEKYILI